MARTNNGARPSGLGAGAVFLTTISTILGAVLFLRFGYAVAHVGLVGALLIIVIGHLVTIPTSMAIAEIATNQKVEGGGVYYMISRSFGLVIGGTIGIALYLSQAVSVAFYVIAFAEAFRPALTEINLLLGTSLADLRWISVPSMLGLAVLMQTRGANLGLKALNLVVGVLFLSLILFLFGHSDSAVALDATAWTRRLQEPDSFFLVFAIIFPAFTGLTAGVGLSGDLRDSKRAIPLGTLLAVALGLGVYVLVAIKLAVSADPATLDGVPLVMSRIALWGPIIPIGLACATFSSALGSVLVAPRTLQALAADSALPSSLANRWLAITRKSDQEPLRASVVTCLLALVFVAAGDVDSIAQVISMFFMVTYGAICTISLLEQFAADPAYRPSFRSRWWISLLGALLSIWLMFEMSPVAALISLGLLLMLYRVLRRHLADTTEPADLIQGAIFQLSRRLQLALQRAQRSGERVGWRPSVVALAEAGLRRRALFDLLRWIGHRQGFATYIAFVHGYLSKATNEEAEEERRRLIRQVEISGGNIHVDTLVSPSYTSAFTQLIQLPGISGKRNNLVAFEYDRREPDQLRFALEHHGLATVSDFDVCILSSSERSYGYRRQLHVWITPRDVENASLMIMLAYIIVGHPDWADAEIKVREVVREGERDEREEDLRALIRAGRLPITERNIEVLVADRDFRSIVAEGSRDADLVLIGFRREVLRRLGAEFFEGWDDLGDVLFCNAVHEIEMEREPRSAPAPEAEPETEPEASDEGAESADEPEPEGAEAAKSAAPDEAS